MAFILKKKIQNITDSIQLQDQDGNALDTILISIDPYAAAHEFNKAYNVLLRAQIESKKKSGAMNAQAIGEAVIALMRVCFGSENTDKLLAYYDGKAEELFMNVFPYITETIVPKMRAASKEAAERMKASVLQAKR